MPGFPERSFPVSEEDRTSLYSRPTSTNDDASPRNGWTEDQEDAFAAHVRARTVGLSTDDVAVVRQAIPAAGRQASGPLSHNELESFTARLQDDLVLAEDRLIPDGMASTFSVAMRLSIMFPAQPGRPLNQSTVIFLNTEDQEDHRDDLLARLDEADSSVPVTLDGKYDRSVSMSTLLGTESSALQSYRDVLTRIRPRFDPLMNLRNAVNVPNDTQLTAVYDGLTRLSHQLVCVDMPRDEQAQRIRTEVLSQRR